MLLTLATCSSSRIFARRSFSSGLRVFLAIAFTSIIVSLLYTMILVYTKFGVVSVSSKLGTYQCSLETFCYFERLL